MSFTYGSPINSFVQFPCNDLAHNCAPDFPMCLPLMLESDVRFEVFIETDETQIGDDSSWYLYARVVSQCNTQLPAPADDSIIGQFDYTLLLGGEIRDKRYVATLNYLSQDDIDAIECGKCCYIQLWKRKYTLDILNPYTDTLLACSCCFQKICDPCWTSVLSYRCNEDAFGFQYYQTVGGGGTNVLANYFNTIRLPFYLRKPQYPTTRNVFVKSDGSRKKLSARIGKEYTLVTDWWPTTWQEKLVMAVEHDTVKIENTNANIIPAQEFTSESTPEQKYEDRLDFPLARTDFKIFLTPYNRFNSNCK